jgi:hypothetical protein
MRAIVRTTSPTFALDRRRDRAAVVPEGVAMTWNVLPTALPSSVLERNGNPLCLVETLEGG